jgi:uncharacterized protein (TIGR02452 family)
MLQGPAGARRVHVAELAAVAAETLLFIKEGGYVAPSGRVVTLSATAAIATTHLRRDVELLARADVIAAGLRARAANAVAVEVTAERAGACAARLLLQGARHVGVLNFANGIRPGGGFLHGARAQEEALCRCSTLYPCLSASTDAARSFYGEGAHSGSALVTDHVLVSPGVTFFRDEDHALLEQPFLATVLTAAAPDQGWLRAAVDAGNEPASRFGDVPAVFQRRTRAVLAAAVDAGIDAVVLGAWGCGAFGNDPDMVAAAFHDAVAELGGALAHVVFAVYGAAANRAAFERRFGAVTST